MNRRTSRRVEALLRSGAPGARRAPSQELKTRIASALEPEALRHGRAPAAETAARSAWRERWQSASVAASVAIALGLWVFAFSGLVRQGPGPLAQRETVAPRSTGGVLAQLARGTPETLLKAVDDPLLAELDHMAQDATQAARFLVGRLPASLVTR